MKRKAEEVAAGDMKRRVLHVRFSGKMPGAWPDDDLSDIEPKEQMELRILFPTIAEIKDTFTEWWTGKKPPRTPVRPASRRVAELKDAFSPQFLTNSSPLETSTPIFTPRTKAAANSSAKRLIKKYVHGERRPQGSILRSSRSNYRPFEGPSFVPIPLYTPEKSSDEEEKEARIVDEDGDLEMMEAPVPLPSSRRTHFLTPERSVWTGELMERMYGRRKYFYEDLGIKENVGPSFSKYREPSLYDPDESYLDTPPPIGYNQEQLKSPEYLSQYHRQDFARHADNLVSQLDQWAKAADKRDAEDSETPLSKEMQERYAQKRTERVMREAKLRHEKEQAARDAIERKKKAKILEEQRKAKLEAEQRRLAEEKKREEERAAAERAHIDALEKAERDHANLIKKWTIVPTAWLRDKENLRPLLDSISKATRPSDIVVKKTNLSAHDFSTLVPHRYGQSDSGWLNDNIVNTTLQHIVDAANAELGHSKTDTTTPAPYHTFNSAWYGKVTSAGGSSISRWGAKRGVNYRGNNVLRAKKILFPVCTSSHWTISVLNMADHSIEVMNSLDTNPSSSYNMGIAKAILAWLKHELQDDYVEGSFILQQPMTNMQDNGKDCGVFTVLNALARIKNVPTPFMRESVSAETTVLGRWWIGAILWNGGLMDDFPFELRVDYEREHQDAPATNPDYYRPG